MKISVLMILALGIALAPGVRAQTAPNGGLLVTQVSSSQWQVRLISGTIRQRFSGVIQSNQAITGVQTVQLEPNDSAALLTPTSLGATFATRPGGTDGVNFTASAGATLCLQSAGSTTANIYVGADLQSAVAVTAPVALAGTNACGSTTQGNRKLHVGQWIVMSESDGAQSVMATAIQPGVIGIVKRYPWASLEPTQGNYDFSVLASDLAWAAANGMHLIAMIEDKTFLSRHPNPAYLDAYTGRNVYGGYTMARWDPVVVTRFNALVKALGAQFDSNQWFEGIATQESATSMSGSAMNALGYTPENTVTRISTC